MGDARYYKIGDVESGRNVTWAGLAVNVALIILKILGGVYGGSKALLADAAHSVSDFVTDVIVLIGLHFFRKEKDADHPYGHGKIETLATIGIGAVLCFAAVKIGLDAALAIHRGELTAPERFTIIIAALSIVSKEALFQATFRIGKRLKSESLIANAWHHRSDAWSSVVTLAGISLAVYVPSLKVLDSYAALLVSFFILKIAIDILLSAIKKIIDTSPSAGLMAEVEEEIRKEPGVLDCHDLTGRYYASMIAMEVHIEVDPGMTVKESHDIINRVVARVRTRFIEISTLLVHIDPYIPGRDKEEEGH
jgi:cation diffusion facilitator family transporter